MGATIHARLRAELAKALEAEHTPHEVATSFAIGVFVTTLPTGGVGLVLFAVLAHFWSWVSKVAIFSSALVLNPFVKPAVYVASYWVGALVLDPEPLVFFDVSVLDAVIDILLRVLLGNVLIAAVLAGVGYVVSYRLTVVFRRRDERGEWNPTGFGGGE